MAGFDGGPVWLRVCRLSVDVDTAGRFEGGVEMGTNRGNLLAGSSGLAISAAVGRSMPRTASAQDTVKIRWWHIVTDETNKGILKGVADAFSAANPGVT